MNTKIKPIDATFISKIILKIKIKNMQQLNTIEEIKSAVNNGQTVYAGSAAYTVIKDTLGRYLIKCGAHYIGLTWSDDTTLNANFFFTNN